jgi:hypothetical protein
MSKTKFYINLINYRKIFDMERVETLCERLKEQITKNVSLDELLITVQMLQSELLHLKNTTESVQYHSAVNIDIPSIVLPEENPATISKNAIIEFMIDDFIEEEKNEVNEMVVGFNEELVDVFKIENEEKNTDEVDNKNLTEVISKPSEEFNLEKEGVKEMLVGFNEEMVDVFKIENEEKNTDESAGITLADEISKPLEELKEEEKVVMMLELDESVIEEELQQIKKSAEIKNTVSSVNKPLMLFDPLEEIPTLLHQRIEEHQTNPFETNDHVVSHLSINDKLKQENQVVSEQINSEPIKDLKKAISINERFLFISELFNGDEAMYDRSIKTINAFSIYPEAEYWIRRELKIKFAWDEKSNTVKQFNQLVKRRFSAT